MKKILIILLFPLTVCGQWSFLIPSDTTETVVTFYKWNNHVYDSTFWDDVIVTGTAAQGFTITPQSAAPTNPTEGTIYYDTEDHMMYFWNGSAWKAMNYTP